MCVCVCVCVCVCDGGGARVQNVQPKPRERTTEHSFVIYCVTLGKSLNLSEPQAITGDSISYLNGCREKG